MADAQPRLHDQFGRHISYVRLSLTDRCDMRCRYCMAEDMTFLPRAEILSLEEIITLAQKFVDRGVKRIRPADCIDCSTASTTASPPK